MGLKGNQWQIIYPIKAKHLIKDTDFYKVIYRICFKFFEKNLIKLGLKLKLKLKFSFYKVILK